MEDQKKQPDTSPAKSNSEGIDNWNNRLDENLEPKGTGSTEADEKAREYSNEKGSGDQSDEASND